MPPAEGRGLAASRASWNESMDRVRRKTLTESSPLCFRATNPASTWGRARMERPRTPNARWVDSPLTAPRYAAAFTILRSYAMGIVIWPDLPWRAFEGPPLAAHAQRRADLGDALREEAPPPA